MGDLPRQLALVIHWNDLDGSFVGCGTQLEGAKRLEEGDGKTPVPGLEKVDGGSTGE